jgi:hypothetical protein
MTLMRRYASSLWSGRRVITQTLLLCFALMIYTPFMMIALRSVGKGWFGRLWLNLHWTGTGGLSK